jgi:hypothetical protein
MRVCNGRELTVCLMAGFLAAVLLAACTRDSPPRGILPRPEMESVLWDLIQANQYSFTFIAKDSGKVSVKDEDLKLYEEVFELHHTTREKFQESYAWYMKHPELVRNIFDSLLAKGNRLKDESYGRPLPAYNPLKPTPEPTPPVIPVVRPPNYPAGGHPLFNRDSIVAARRRDSITHRGDSITHRRDSINRRQELILRRHDSLVRHLDSELRRHDSTTKRRDSMARAHGQMPAGTHKASLAGTIKAPI